VASGLNRTSPTVTLSSNNFSKMAGGSTDAARYIKSSSEQIGWLSLIFEFMKTSIDVSLIICLSIFRFFVPAPKKDLSGEVVVVTGAAGYIGRRLALKFAEKGAAVVLWDVNKDGIEEVAEEIKETGGHAFPFCCNLKDKHDIQRTASKVSKDVGDPTILVNNAGIVAGKGILDLSEDDIEATFDVNILAHFWTVRAFLPAMMKANHGHIVSVASILGTDGLGHLTEYCATKYAANGFMESLRRELDLEGFDRIYCTTVNPFVIDTELFQGVTIRFSNMPLLPILKPDYVVEKIMDAVQRNQILLHIPKLCYVTPVLKSILPVKAADRLHKFLGSDKAMSTFIGRRKKH